MRLWIKKPLAVWTGTSEDAAGGIVINGEEIIELVPSGCSPQTHWEECFDAQGLVILPGLVNCHHHFYQTLTRAFPKALNKALFPWLKSLYPVWAGLDEEAIAVSTELAIAELMLSGCTLVSDHHYLFNPSINAAIDVQFEVVEKMGVRAVLTRGAMSLGESKGGLPPDSVVQRDEQILSESERLLKLAENYSLASIALAPCSPFSVTPELMRESAALARKYKARLHTHLSETEDENTFCQKKFQLRPVDYLESVGWLESDVWLAHGIYFNDSEIERLGKAGVGVSHCPSSNMVLSSGMCRTLELEKAGVAIGLGVDGSASNDSSNLIQEVRQAFLLQRLLYGAENIDHDKAFSWSTMGGARVLGEGSRVGEIKKGKKADLAFFDLDELRFSGAGDPVAALLLCGAHRVKHLMVNGTWRVKNGEIPECDLQNLKHKHVNAARKLAENS